MKKLFLALLMLVDVHANGMHQQQYQHDQVQIQEQKKSKKKQRRHFHDENENPQESKPEDADESVADLKSALNVIVDTIIKEHGSIENHIKVRTPEKKKRIELCPVCGQLDCPWTKEIYE